MCIPLHVINAWQRTEAHIGYHSRMQKARHIQGSCTLHNTTAACTMRLQKHERAKPNDMQAHRQKAFEKTPTNACCTDTDHPYNKLGMQWTLEAFHPISGGTQASRSSSGSEGTVPLLNAQLVQCLSDLRTFRLSAARGRPSPL